MDRENRHLLGLVLGWQIQGSRQGSVWNTALVAVYLYSRIRRFPPSLPFLSVVETEATLVSGFFLGPVSLLVAVPAAVVVQVSGDRVETFLALDEV